MATKKISELPLITRVSGSQEGGTVLPIVVGGTTDQISVENFSKFITAYSAHTGSAGNTFTGPQTINNNVTITGKLTVNELVATYETASVIYSEGGNIFGNELTDKQQLTGSVNITGSLIYNNVLVTNIDANTINRLQQTTASLNTFTSSQADRNLVLSTVTGSINQATASIQFQTASLLQFTASQDSRNFTLSQVTGSFNYFYQASASLQTFTSSQADRNLVLSTVTGSINQATASLQFHSASVEAQLARIQQATASLELASASFKYFYQSTASLQTFTSSQADRNLVLSTVTGSINQATASLQQFTASQDSRNLTLSTVTGSLIGITNGLMAFTAALDNTYATDAQLYQLYQATRSLELHSGSMIGVTNGLMAYTASNTSLNTGLRGEVDGIEAYTASLKGQAIVSSSTQVRNYDVFALNSNLFTATGSLIGITNGLMAFTAALDSTYATDAQLFQLYQATRSIELTTGSLIGITNGLMALTASMKAASIVSSSTQVQNYDVFALNSNLYNSTGSLIGITNGLMALTASMKGQAIVSSSTQVQNYDVFALNSNLYNGTGSLQAQVNGIMAVTASLKAAAIVSSSQQIANYYKFAETASASTKFYGNVTASGNLSVGADSFTSPGGADKFIGVFSGQDSSIILQDSVETWEIYMNDDLYFTTGSTNPKNVMSLRRITGNVEINEGNLVIGKAGKGIDFSITSNGSGTTSSEILSDYEEGTFTPTIEGSSTAGTGTYTTQQGTYTKIGNLVTISVWVSWSAHTGTGNLQLAGFPFTSIGTTNYRASGTFGWVENLTLSANNIVTMAITPSSTKSDVTQYPAGGGAASSVPLDAAANLHYSITYQTA